MQENTTFKITYYSNKDKKHITRDGKWTDKSQDIGQVSKAQI